MRAKLYKCHIVTQSYLRPRGRAWADTGTGIMAPRRPDDLSRADGASSYPRNYILSPNSFSYFRSIKCKCVLRVLRSISL